MWKGLYALLCSHFVIIIYLMNVNFMYVFGEYEHLLYILCPLYVLFTFETEQIYAQLLFVSCDKFIIRYLLSS